MLVYVVCYLYKWVYYNAGSRTPKSKPGTLCCSKAPKRGARDEASGDFYSGNQGTDLYDTSCNTTESH